MTEFQALEALRSAEDCVVRALRGLKELEAPDLQTSHGPAGGPHRHKAMNHLRAALHDLVLALDYHRVLSIAMPTADRTAAASVTEEPQAFQAPTS